MIKRIIFTVAIFSVSLAAFPQSKSYQALKNRFGDREDVHSFSLGGFVCKAAIRIALPNDRLMRTALKDIQHVRIIVIPKKEFAKQDLTVGGFEQYLLSDSFESMATIRDHGDHVMIFHRKDGNKKDRYFVLVEEPTEVVAIEMKGYLDPEVFKDENNRISLK